MPAFDRRPSVTTIDLIYFNAGGGHRAAALALQSVLRVQRPAWTVRLVDLFEVLDPQAQFQRLTGMAPEAYYNKRLATGWTLGLAQELKLLLEDNAPYNARVTFHADGRSKDAAAAPSGTTGWNAPELSPWLENALNAASQAHYGAPLGYMGQGGTIPLMSMLQKGFPKAQMMVCGVLGPKSNAHGPNEFLHVPYGKKLTAAVAQVIAACP